MKTFVKIFLILFLCSSLQAAIVTSVQTGDWSTGSTWDSDPAIPVNGDTVVIANGHTVTFDADQSGFANGVDLTITGTLDCETAAGDYYLMCSADVDGAGDWYIGTSTSVPLPSGTTMTVDLNGGNQIDGSGGLTLYWYCLQPTNYYITLDDGEPLGETAISVDTDVTADIWAAGDHVSIIDATTTTDAQLCTIDAGGIAAAQITIVDTGAEPDDALDSAVVANALMVLVTRNIRVIGCTTYPISEVDDSYIACEIATDNTDGIYLCDGTEFAGVLDGVRWTIRAGTNNTLSGVVTDCYQILSESGLTISGALVAGTGLYSLGSCSNVTVDSNSLFFGSGGAFTDCSSCAFNGTIKYNYYPFLTCSALFMYGTIDNCTYGLYAVDNSVLSCTFSNNTTDLRRCINGKSYNTLFGGGTEFYEYDYAGRHNASYFSSEDHDQTTNAFKAWCTGGIVTSQTASPPTGYSIYYQHTCEDTTQTKPIFRQFETTVLAGTALEVDGYLQIPNGEDMTGYAPALQIIDVFDDPLIDSTADPLDEDEIPDPDGSEVGWQAVSVIWANQGDAPRKVYVRAIAWHDGGGDDVVINSAWSVADYKDQIDTIYSVLMPLKTDVATADSTTSFTLAAGEATNDAYNNMSVMVQDADDDHWELRSITDWTSGLVITVDTAFSFTPVADDLVYIMGTSYGAPIDNDAIADAVWDEPMAGHTGEAAFGGELQTLDPNITLILADTDEIQGKLPGDYMMSSSNTLNYNDEITDIINDTVYIGTPVALDGGSATLSSMLTKMADDNGGSNFDATTDSQEAIANSIGALPSAATVADAVWDEVIADHTGETTFGGEVGGLDPNITLILADTDELQTDWADDGRLDLILDQAADPYRGYITGALYDQYFQTTGWCEPLGDDHVMMTGYTSNSFSIVSVENRDVPTLTGQLVDNTNLDGAEAMAQTDPNIVWVCCYDIDSIAKIDVTDYSNPTYLEKYTDDVNLAGPECIAVDYNDTYGWIAYVGSNSGDAITSVQLSDGTILDTVTVGNTLYHVQVTDDGDTVFATCRDDGYFVSVDVSDPESMSVLDTYESGGTTMGFDLNEDETIAYVAYYNQSYILVIDISDPSSMSKLGQTALHPFDMTSGLNTPVTVGNYVLATCHTADSVCVFEVGTPSDPNHVTYVQDTGTLNYLDDCIWFKERLYVTVRNPRLLAVLRFPFLESDNVNEIKDNTDNIVLLTTDVNDVNDAGVFTVKDGEATDYFYDGYVIMVQDVTDEHWEVRIIDGWTDSLQVTLNEDLYFTPAEGDTVYIMGWDYWGNAWDKVQAVGMTTNVVNTIDEGASAGMGATIFTGDGSDP